MVDLNATQAAIRAGYSEKTAKQIATENLAKPVLQEAIAEQRRKLSENTGITVEYIVQRLEENLGKALVEVPVKDCNGAETGVYKYDGAVANKAIELLGKTIGAFTDNIKHEGDLNIAVKNYTRN